MSWTHVDGRVSALPARRGDEPGTYLWIDAGERHERLVAELFLPAVAAEDLDGALGVAVGSVRGPDGDRTGEVRLEFGRVRDGRGVLSAAGAGLDADIRFDLSGHPPEGGFCRHCGAELEVDVVSVITPPDGGVIGMPRTRCGACGAR
ncbi:MAG TPA: hypothetical protein VE777_00295 [Gaiellales bacterium]|nr:hypothetical protein [Gaiellales bacterium]